MWCLLLQGIFQQEVNDLPSLKLTVRPWKKGLPRRKCHLRIIHFQVRFVSFRRCITYNNGPMTKTYSPGSILKHHWYYSVYGAQHWSKGTNIHSDHLIFQPAFFGQIYISSRWLHIVGCSFPNLGAKHTTCETATYRRDILLMEEILHQLISSLSHYLQSFIHTRWLFGIASINCIIDTYMYLAKLKYFTAPGLRTQPDAVIHPQWNVC